VKTYAEGHFDWGRADMTDTQLTRESVVATAAELVRRDGPGALTMRRLAAELGAAVTAIYWHVGNREALLDEVVASTVREMGRIEAVGATPARRAESVALELRRKLRQRPHLIALVHERGLTELMMLPAQRALVHEAHAAGLRGEQAAQAVRALQFQVVGFVLVWSATGSGRRRSTTGSWPGRWPPRRTRTRCSRPRCGPWCSRSGRPDNRSYE
jgi:TetR/AcrR family tetracycline transcriptional repressor